MSGMAGQEVSLHEWCFCAAWALGFTALGLAIAWLLLHAQQRAGEKHDASPCAVKGNEGRTLLDFAKGMKDYALGMRAYAQGMHEYALGMKEFALCQQGNGGGAPGAASSPTDGGVRSEFAYSGGCAASTMVQCVNGKVITTVTKKRNGRESVTRFEDGVLVSGPTLALEPGLGGDA